MPHDINGSEIKAGDIVMVPCVVESVYQTDDGLHCNCNVKTQLPMPPYEGGTAIVLNAKQVILSRRPA